MSPRGGFDAEGLESSEEGPGASSSPSQTGRHRGSGLSAARLLQPDRELPDQGAAAGWLSGAVLVFVEPE